MFKPEFLEKLSNYNHIIWDWNGTILNDVDIAVAAVNGTLTKLGAQIIERDHYLQEFGFPVADFYKKIGIEITEESKDEVSELFHKNYQQHFKSCQIFNKITSVFTLLREQGKKQYILSAGAQWLLDDWVKSFKIENYFEGIYGINDLHASSKTYRGFDLIKEQSIEDLSQCIMIGDTLHDHHVASELKISSILIADGHQSFDRLSQAKCLVLDSKYN